MRTVFLVVLFLTLVGLTGCDSHSEMVGNEAVQPFESVKVEKPGSRIHPEEVVTQSDLRKEGELVEKQNPSRIQETAPARKSQLLGGSLVMGSKLYLTKGGELLGDLTIRNKNHVSVHHITVHCVEYNMNHSPVREATAVWDKTLRPGESGYWDQVNFGYAHDDFDTVHCEIATAEFS